MRRVYRNLRIPRTIKKVLILGLIASVTGIVLIVWTWDTKIKANSSNLTRVRNQFVADILPFSSDIDVATVRSAGNYIVLAHLVRPLVKRNSQTQLEANLAVKWEILDGARTYRFFLDPGAKYSNGEAITAEDVKATLERTKTIGHAVHFDFSKISKISADHQTLTIYFNSPELDFLEHAHHPEFGPLHSSDYQTLQKAPSFHISSGPYAVLERMQTHGSAALKLKKNPYFPESQIDAPDKLELQSSTDEEKLTGLTNRNIDFAMPLGAFSDDQQSQILRANNSELQPRIGFTYWISINSVRIPDRSIRNSIQAIFNNQTFGDPRSHLWEDANQLYLPGGPSRLSKLEEAETWRTIANSHAGKSRSVPLKLLMSDKFYFSNQVLEQFKAMGFIVAPTYYKSQDEFAKFVTKNRNDFDLIQTNNDFSSFDLIENITVALNPARPLVFTGADADSQEIQMLLGHAQKADASSRQELLGDLGKKLLENGFVIPIAYYHLYFYHTKDYSFDRWSKLFPEVAFWKLSRG